jgi:hypothetical protein
MRPFKKIESAFTKTAQTLTPSANQAYSASIQQTPLRQKISAAIIVFNQQARGMSSYGGF